MQKSIPTMLDADRIFAELRSDLEKAEHYRISRYQKIVPFKRFFLFCLFLGVIFIVYPNINPKFPDDMWGIGVFFFFLGILAYAIKYAYESNKFKKYFQKEIAPQLIAGLGPEFKYDPEGKINEKYFEKSCFFRYYNRYKCEDLVTGRIGGKPVVFGEIHLEKVSGSGSKSKKSSIFKGVFINIELGSSFPSPFWILPAKGKLHHYYPGLKKVGGEIFATGQEEFSNTFTVFCVDTKITGILLQKSILNSLTSLNRSLQEQKVINDPLILAFIDNHIFVAIDLKQRLLEGSLRKPVNTKDFISKQLLFLNSIYRIGKIIG